MPVASAAPDISISLRCVSLQRLDTYHLGTPPCFFLLISQTGAYRPGLVTQRRACLATCRCEWGQIEGKPPPPFLFPLPRFRILLGLIKLVICGICGPARTRRIALSKEGRPYVRAPATLARRTPTQSSSELEGRRTRAELEPVRSPPQKRNETKRERFPPSSGPGHLNSLTEHTVTKPDSWNKESFNNNSQLTGPIVCIRRFP